jgi:hypothetical protein
LVAIFGLIEIIIELAKLTTICRFGNVLDVDLPPSSSIPSVDSTPRDDCWSICCATVLLGLVRGRALRPGIDRPDKRGKGDGR